MYGTIYPSFQYVQELAQDDLINQVRFSLPTYIAERYGKPPVAVETPKSDSSQTKLHIITKVNMASFIEKIVSPSHRRDITCTKVVRGMAHGSPVYTSTVTFRRSASPLALNRDFILSIQATDLDKPRCVAEVDRERKSVVLSLTHVPNFGAGEIKTQEYIFVIDRSGSMSTENRIVHAKYALQVLLANLPHEGTFFNIVGFGSSFQKLWSTSQPYGARTKNIAVCPLCIVLRKTFK